MINWKLRLKNKTTLVTLATLVIAFGYQVLAAFDVVPKVSESALTELVMMLINILAALGVVVDPTTAGVSDSTQALGYEEPKEG